MPGKPSPERKLLTARLSARCMLPFILPSFEIQLKKSMLNSAKFLYSIICIMVMYPALAQLPIQDDITPYPTPAREPGQKKPAAVVKKDGLYGLKKNDSFLLQPIYQEIFPVTAAILQLKQYNKYGVADKNGRIFIPLKYDSIKHIFAGNEALVVYQNGQAGVLNTRGEEILPLQYDTILYSSAVSKYSLVKKDGKILLFFGKDLVDMNYQSLIFYTNLAAVKQQEKYGLLTNGRLVVPPQYDSIYVAQQKSYRAITGSPLLSDYRMMATTLFIVQHNKYGLLDNDGSIITAPEYDNIQFDHYRKVYHLKKDTLTDLYLESTKKKTATAYEQVYSDGMRFITVKKNGRYGIINYQLQQVMPCAYDKIDIMGSSGNLRAVQNGKTGLFNDKGKMIIPVLYDTIDDFSLAEKLRGLYKVALNGRKGIVDAANDVIVPPVYEDVVEMNDFLVVRSGKKYGLYSRDGKRVCDTVYQGFKPSFTKYSPVVFSYKDSLKGIIKEDGTILYEPVFTSTGYITDTDGLLNPYGSGKKKYLYVKDRNNKMGVFEETSAQLIIPVVYDGIYQKLETTGGVFFSVKKGTRFGVIHSNDSIVIPLEYDSVDMSRANPAALHEPEVVVKKGNLYGALTLAGKLVIPIAYSSLVKLSDDNLYKARKPQGQVLLLDDKNKVVNAGPFDDIGLFEGNLALSFLNGRMRLLNKTGALVSEEVPMEPHTGYTSFEAFKQALINALNSGDNKDLEIFAYKAAPSWHMLFLIKRNIITGEALGVVSPEGVREKYLKDLLLFKKTKWKTGGYPKNQLTGVDDYTFSDDGLITNKRLEETNFGDSQFLAKFLQDAVRVNGYWISAYFMTRGFYNP